MRGRVILVVLLMTLAGIVAAPAAHAQSPGSSLEKAVRNQTTIGSYATTASATPGHHLVYRLIFTNTGDVALTGVTITDTLEPRQTLNFCNGCAQNGSTLTWGLGTVDPGANREITFGVRLDASFPTLPAEITNVAVSDSNEQDAMSSNQTTITVVSGPFLFLQKSGIPLGGTLLRFDMRYTNSGDTAATDVTITDEVPADAAFVTCSNSCTVSGTTATWNIATVAPGASSVVTMTVDPLSTAGCEVCNIATIESPDQPGGPRSSNQVCLDVPANPALVSAAGAATGAIIESPSLDLDLTIPEGNDGADDDTSVDSSRTGGGSHSEFDEQLSVDIPEAPGSVLHADVFRTVTTSSGSPFSTSGNASSVATASDVDILDGAVTATLVRAVAGASAGQSSVSAGSLGSKIEGLTVLGVPQTAFPGARIALPALTFGAGSYVAIWEELKSQSVPTGTSGGTYISDITVNMIRVHVTDMDDVGVAEIIVGHASAHAQSPQQVLCEPPGNLSVGGHALMAQLHTDPDLAPVVIGDVEITSPEGGYQKKSVDTIYRDGVLFSETASTSSNGYTLELPTTGSSFSTSSAEVETLCLIPSNGLCAISATAVRAVATSDARPTSRLSDATRTELVGLKIGATPVSAPIDRNTIVELPGIGFAILNEQVCDNGANPALRCSDGMVPGQTGLTVRAIHVFVLDPAAGAAPGAELIVAEAHSDGLYVP